MAISEDRNVEPIQEQSQANKFIEGGIFYPTGHVLIAVADAALAARALSALQQAGFLPPQLLAIDAGTMEREAGDNLANHGILSVGASLPAREMQLNLAREGCHFLLIHAPEEEDHLRAVHSLTGLPVRYAVKYRTLVIENLINDVPHPAHDSEPVRVD